MKQRKISLVKDNKSLNINSNLSDNISPEVIERKSPRRRYSAAYKLKILARADACSGKRGELGRLLRSEGLYSTMLLEWRRARDSGILRALAPQKRGAKAREINPLRDVVAKLEHDKINLAKQLEIAQKIIEVQKKIAEIFTVNDQAPSSGKMS
jgi:transposase-like protein